MDVFFQSSDDISLRGVPDIFEISALVFCPLHFIYYPVVLLSVTITDVPKEDKGSEAHHFEWWNPQLIRNGKVGQITNSRQ